MKYAWVEAHRGQFAITRMCRLLSVSRTGYCQWRGRAPSQRSIANTVLDVQVAAIHAQSRRSYGRGADSSTVAHAGPQIWARARAQEFVATEAAAGIPQTLPCNNRFEAR